ncbi:MAG: phage baseplate assembly protein [Gemmatimonadales bacterium]|jgi:phage baseplate assembly protein V
MISEIERRIDEVLRPLRLRVTDLLRRAVVKLVDDSPAQGEVQLAGTGEGEDRDTADRVEHFEHYGLTTRPPVGSEAIVLHLGGASDHPVAVATAYREARPHPDDPGDVVLWDLDGQLIMLRRTKIAIMPAAGNACEVGPEAPLDLQSVARVTDSTSSTAVEDPVYWLWIGAVHLVVKPLYEAIYGVGSMPPLPAALAARITSGSSVLKADS